MYKKQNKTRQQKRQISIQTKLKIFFYVNPRLATASISKDGICNGHFLANQFYGFYEIIKKRTNENPSSLQSIICLQHTQQ